MTKTEIAYILVQLREHNEGKGLDYELRCGPIRVYGLILAANYDYDLLLLQTEDNPMLYIPFREITQLGLVVTDGRY